MARRAATSPRKQPSQERSRATVDALLQATAQLLQRDGYDRTSTNRIAEAAGVSVGSVYQYFPSKEALVAALIEREVEAQLQVVVDKMAEVVDAPLPVAVRGMIEAVVASHRVHPRLHKVLTEEVPRVGALARLAEMERKLAEMLERALVARRREVRPRDLGLAAFLLTYAVEGVLHGAVHSPSRLFDRSEQGVDLIDELTELVLRYLA